MNFGGGNLGREEFRKVFLFEKGDRVVLEWGV